MYHTFIIHGKIIMITTSPLHHLGVVGHHVIGKNITIPTTDLLHRRRHTMKGNPDILMSSVHLTIDLRLHLIMVLHLRHTMDLLLHRRLHTMKANPDILMSSVHLTIDLLHLIMVLHLRHTMDLLLHRRLHPMKGNPDILMSSVHLTIEVEADLTIVHRLHRTMVHHHRTIGLHLTMVHRPHRTMDHHPHRTMDHRLDGTIGLRLHHTMDLHLMTGLHLLGLITIITLNMATKPIDNLMVIVHLTLMTLHPKIVGLHRMAKDHLVQTGNPVNMGHTVITGCNLVLHQVFHPPRILNMNRFFKTLNLFSRKGFIILHRMIRLKMTHQMSK
ncbi:uncharacterized protein LOC134806478 [Cydia splendana]|uniref:uncharacterized protein LOC134806478 n=1 Tax=Cydia splendana TaxID=1100963 RepID=UPI00300DBC96